jgi:hypothetical protein
LIFPTEFLTLFTTLELVVQFLKVENKVAGSELRPPVMDRDVEAEVG